MRLLVRLCLALGAFAFGLLAYVYLTLPDVRDLRDTNPPTTFFMELRDREALARGATPRRQQEWVPFDRISPHLRRTVLVAEDDAFWQHDGLDYRQIRESIAINLDARAFVRGASTITQQLAKNLYLSPSKDPVRKLRELLIARRLETELSKQRIFEIYLNVIEWGDGIYGAEAASRTYFRKPASDLTVEEAALLAGAVVNPRLLDPSRPGRLLVGRQRTILARLGAARTAPATAAVAPAEPEPAAQALGGDAGASWPEVREAGPPAPLEALPWRQIDEAPPVMAPEQPLPDGR